jgi:chromate reductase
MANDGNLDVLVICGSLRKGSYNAALARTLPGLAPAAMKLRTAPPFDTIPHYNFDTQNATGFPAEVNAFADAIRSADAVIIVSPEYNWTIPGALKNAIDWVSRMKDSRSRTSQWRCNHALAACSAAPACSITCARA